MNHIATNLVTKGLLNISNITKGMINFSYEIVFRKRGGGGGWTPKQVPLHYERESLYTEIKKHEESDIDYIKVYVDWFDYNLKGYKKIDAKLLKNHIEAEILTETSKHVSVKIV